MGSPFFASLKRKIKKEKRKNSQPLNSGGFYFIQIFFVFLRGLPEDIVSGELV